MDVVKGFLQGLTKEEEEEEVDEAVLSYIADCLEDAEDESALEGTSEVLSSASTTFAALPENEKLCRLLELMQKVQIVKQTSSTPALDTAAATAARPSQAPGTGQDTQPTSLPNTRPNSDTTTLPSSCTSDHPAAASGSGSSQPAAGQAAAGQPLSRTGSLQPAAAAAAPAAGPAEQPAAPADDPQMQQLVELCPGVGTGFLGYVLRSRGSLQAAVEWLLDVGEDVSQLEADWQQRSQQQQQQQQLGLEGQQGPGDQQQEDRRLRQQVLARFDLEAIPLVASGSSARRQQALRPVNSWTPSAGEPASKVRYRDGQAVTTKGEKFVVQKIGEEWDGGSRGKVMTKGKRGKGFV